MLRPIEGGLIKYEVDQITNDRFMKPDSMKYKAILHTVDSDIYIDFLESVEILRDYSSNIADYILVSFQLPMGDYIKDIVPNMNNLEMSLVLYYYNRTFTTKYKFIINKKGGVFGSRYDHMTKEELNKEGMVNVVGQCVDKLVEAMRTLTVDGVYNYTTPAMVIKNVIKHTTSLLELEGEKLDIAINMVDPNNQRIYRHINLPTGINVFDVPSYIQNTDYGVYNTGIGTYFQPYGGAIGNDGVPIDTMFIYPLYNTRLYDKSEKKLSILVEPTGLYKNSEYTFTVNGDIVKIIVSGDTTNFDDSDNAMINEGSGIIAASPLSNIIGSKMVEDEEINNIPELHLKGEKFKERQDGVTKPKYLKATSNIYTHRSDIAARNVTLYQVEWRFCNHELLFPGMPTAITYVNKKLGTITLKGILQSVFIKYSTLNKSTSAILNVLVEKTNSILEMEEENV